MTRETYLMLQLSNLNHAINLGTTALDTARTLQTITERAGIDKTPERLFIRDSLKIYDINEALALIEHMPLQLKDFKNQMIEIKMDNDKMLLEGGFIPCIDKEIAEIFIKYDLSKMYAMDPQTIVAIEDALNTLNNLKAEITAIQNA